MRLLVVEIRRLFARRFFWIGSIALLVGLGVTLLITAAQSEIPDAADRARAEKVAAEQAQQAERERADCRRFQEEQQPSSPTDRYPPGFDCDQIVAAPVDAFLVNDPFRFTDEMYNRTHVLTAVLALFAFLVGATAVGAEWHHGTLAALLLWEPRRFRVFLAKLLGLLASMAVVAAVAYAAGIAGHWAVAQLRGVVGDITVNFQRDVGLITLRGFALTLVAAAVGYALALMLRRTAAALGVLIGYFAIFEIGGRAFFDRSVEPYLMSSYVAAWMNGRLTLVNYDCDIGGDCAAERIRLTLEHGAIYLGGLALVLLVLAAFTFRRREVA
jgi:ABC-2 type transport system permease protein